MCYLLSCSMYSMSSQSSLPSGRQNSRVKRSLFKLGVAYWTVQCYLALALTLVLFHRSSGINYDQLLSKLDHVSCFTSHLSIAIHRPKYQHQILIKKLFICCFVVENIVYILLIKWDYVIYILLYYPLYFLDQILCQQVQ